MYTHNESHKQLRRTRHHQYLTLTDLAPLHTLSDPTARTRPLHQIVLAQSSSKHLRRDILISGPQKMPVGSDSTGELPESER